MLFVIVALAGLAHLLWSAELDVMNPQTENFQTLGMDYDNPNERKSLLIGTIIAMLVAVVLYFFGTEGSISADVKVMLVIMAFFGARVYLFYIRTKLYYAEK